VFLEGRRAAHGRQDTNKEDALVIDFFDLLETRSPAEREAALLAALPAQVTHAQSRSAAFAQILKGVDAQPASPAVRRWHSCRSRVKA
jgi:hypothetical protein